MNQSLQSIPLLNLTLAFIPVLVVILIIWKWQLGYKGSIYAVFRMLIQLLLVGYVLAFIFETDSSLVVIGVLTIMLFFSSWIAMRTINLPTITLYSKSLLPISLLAVGLVSLPGMMTGPILSGISPMIAVRYQIMVMCMIFGSAGIASALFLVLVEPCFKKSSIK